jgi:hypothetical protein
MLESVLQQYSDLQTRRAICCILYASPVSIAWLFGLSILLFITWEVEQFHAESQLNIERLSKYV